MCPKRKYAGGRSLRDRQHDFVVNDDSVARDAVGGSGAGIYGPCSFAYTSGAPGPHSSSHAAPVDGLG